MKKITLLFLVIALAISTASLASEDSHRLIEKGVQELTKGNYKGALTQFQTAANKNPKEGQAPFYQGVAYNRLGEFQKGGEAFREATSLGFSHPDMSFEVGWNFLGLGRFAEAVAHLKKYESMRPGKGKTSEFLGRAYLGLKQYGKAKKFLLRALARDSSLKPSVLFHLAVVEQASGNKEASKKWIDRLVNEEPDSPIARAFLGKQTAPKVRKGKGPKTSGIDFTIGGGFNNNAIALGHGVALPNDITRQASAFARHSLGAYTNLIDKAKDTLTLYGRFLNDFYEQSGRLTLWDFYGSLNYRHRFSDTLALGVLANNEYSLVHRAIFRDQTNVRTALGWRAIDWWVFEWAYTLGLGNYFPQTNAVQDRDSFSHNLAFNNFFSVPGTDLRGNVGYFYLLNNAEGNDFDFYNHGGLISFSHPLFWKLSAEGMYSRTFSRFGKINSLPGFAFKRRDNVDTITGQINTELFNRVNAFARYSFIDQFSNINFYNYTQHVGSAGFIIDLL